MTRISRPAKAWARLGVSKTTFYQDFVGKGRIKLVKLGERASGVIDDELDALIEEMRRARDAAPPKPTPPVNKSTDRRRRTPAKRERGAR